MNTPTNPSPSSMWWVYFVLVGVLTLSGMLQGPWSPLDVLASIFAAFSLVGLWGYIRQVPIGWKQFWVVYFALSLFLSVVLTVGILVAVELPPGTLGLFLALLALGGLFAAPLYVALWRYAFRSAHLWSEGEAQL